MMITKVSKEGEARIPGEVLERLGIKAGDMLGFEVEDDRLVLRRIEPLDAGFLKLASESFADWDAPEADEAFRDL